jgi:hypothetical protein
VRANLPDSQFFVGKVVPTRPELKVVELIDSGNDGLLFRGHSSDLGRDVACKIVPRSNLVHGPNGEDDWRAEVHKADSLRNPTVVKFEHILEWNDEPAKIDCVVFVSEFVEGKCLRKFLANNRDAITVPFIVLWMRSMLSLFYEMDPKGIRHGDLHSGNILVEDRSSYDLTGPQFVFRVTDFGVADASSEQRFKDDYYQLADILAQLLRLVDYAICSPKEKFIFGALRNEFLGRHLVETDLTRDPLARRPKDLFERLESLGDEFELNAGSDTTNLSTPFDFLSCEQIGEAPALLRALYSDRFLGLLEIESRNNVVVTGPRGCGKTTVFRSLALDQRLRVDDAKPADIHYVGVYFRCDDLYFNFPRYVAPIRHEAIDVPIHFVTSTLLSKLLTSLKVWAKQYFLAEFTQREAECANKIWSVLGITRPSVPGVDTLDVVISRLNKERARAAEWQRFVNDPKRPVGPCFGVDVLLRVCELLSKAFSFARERPVYFLVDD